MLSRETENQLFTHGYKAVGGIDEAGRGPLAGPVVAALVVLETGKIKGKEESYIRDIKDSKKLTAKKREELFEFLQNNFPVAVGICDNRTVDRINIRQAAFLAMKKALGAVRSKPEFLLIDGGDIIPNCSYRQKCIKQGDRSIFSIAAASIVAKVTRDRIMEEMDQKFPEYGFAKHKGYGTKHHLEKIKEHGPCPIHRSSFHPIAGSPGSKLT